MRVITLFLAVLACLLPITAKAAETSAATVGSSVCPFAFPVELKVTCGLLRVPENRSDPTSRHIALLYAIIHSMHPAPQPDPIIYTSSGGPGLGAFGGWKHLTSNFAFLATRDIILLEQRGTRWSDPYLACPDLNQAMFENLTRTLPREQEIAAEVAVALACRDSLREQGVDLAGYTTQESAADLEDLRRLLGIAQWNFIGGSYAARIGLTLARQYPASLRSLVLDSVYDPAVAFLTERVPAFDAALDRLFAACAADSGCAAAYPDLAAHFWSVLERANSEPISVQIDHPRTGAPVTMRLTGDDLALGVFNAMRDPRLIPYLPFVIEQVYAGHTEVLAPLAQNGFSAMFATPLGIYYAIECAEEYPFNDARSQTIEVARYTGLERFLPTPADPFICAAWDAAVVDVSFREPYSGDIPALIFSGEYDAVIAPAVSAQTAARMTHATYVNVRGVSHAVLDVDACARQMAAAFVTAPTAFAPDCVPGREVVFVTGADILPTPLIYRAYGSRSISPAFWSALPIALAFLGLAGIGLSFRTRRPASLAIGGIGALALTIAGGCAWLFFMVDPILLSLGLPMEVVNLVLPPPLMVLALAARARNK